MWYHLHRWWVLAGLAASRRARERRGGVPERSNGAALKADGLDSHGGSNPSSSATMTCYQRHLRWLFEALELPYDSPSRDRVDAALRAVLGVPTGAHCPEVWAAVKSVPDA